MTSERKAPEGNHGLGRILAVLSDEYQSLHKLRLLLLHFVGMISFLVYNLN